jgi:hypothetical protein
MLTKFCSFMNIDTNFARSEILGCKFIVHSSQTFLQTVSELLPNYMVLHSSCQYFALSYLEISIHIFSVTLFDGIQICDNDLPTLVHHYVKKSCSEHVSILPDLL